MSTGGKKLIAALEELAEAIKCEHEWWLPPEDEEIPEGWIVRVCSKCGLRSTTIPQPQERR